MSPSDESRLQQILLDTFGEKIRPGKIAQWIRLLDGYHINAISAAFDQHFRESRFAPAPNNILERLNAKRGMGNRTPEQVAEIIRSLPVKLAGSSAELLARTFLEHHGQEISAQLMEGSYPGHGAAFVRELIEYGNA